MFGDPLTLTRNYTTITADAADNIVLAASERAADHSTYRAIDQVGNDHVLTIGHQYGKRWRFTARYTLIGLVPSTVVPAENNKFTQSVYVVADVPVTGIVQTTGAETSLHRKMMRGIGSLLVSTGTNEALFDRVVRGGET